MSFTNVPFGPYHALPPWLNHRLKNPPQEGGGFHSWLFATACALKKWRCDRHIYHTLLKVSERIRCTTPEVQREREVREAVANATGQRLGAASSALQPGRPVRRSKWPQQNVREIIKIISMGDRIVDLEQASPVEVRPCTLSTEDVIDLVFPKDCLLCGGTAVHAMSTRPREHWRGLLRDLQFVVPSPMRAELGTSRNGRASTRCNENTGERRYLVVECDFVRGDPALADAFGAGLTPQDMCAAILLHLAQSAPLVMAVYSGGKSLHGWFWVQGKKEPRLHEFMRRAVALGADPRMWTRCQPTRMPGGTRDSGIVQKIHFLNTNIII